MSRRPLILPLAVLLIGCVAMLPACKKKTTDTGSGGGDPGPGPNPPPSVSTDYVVFAHLKAKDIRDSALFKEVKQAFEKSGGTAEWDKIEGEAAKEIGIKPTDIDSVTVCVTEAPPRAEPKFVLILASNKTINGAVLLRNGRQTQPDARGLYQSKGEGLVHFPDDKTAVLLHPDLADQYLNGYAKNRTGWPMSAELTKAAAGHTLYAVVQMDKLPAEMRNKRDLKPFAPLLAARTVTLTANLKGKELSVAARGTFPDADAAGKAKETVQAFIGVMAGQVEKVMKGKELDEFKSLMPAVKEAHRALMDAKVAVSGSDLTIAGSYKANFDIGQVVVDAVKQIQGAAGRMSASNNLKQIGLALYAYNDVHQQLPIGGVGPNGLPLKNPKDKQLLSWRVAMLPYIEQGNLYKQFKLDEPWDSEHNKKLIEMMPKIYAPLNKPGKPGYTHLQMVIGPNALQPPSARIPASFPDGTSNTIAVVEAAAPVIWTKPDDLMLPGKELPKDFRKKFGGLQPGGFNVLLWDGSPRFIPDTMSDRTLGLALNPRDGLVLGPDW